VAGAKDAEQAFGEVLDEVLATGGPLYGEARDEFSDEVAGMRLTPVPIEEIEESETDGHLTFAVHVGVAFNAEHIIARDPDDEHGIWGSDLRVEAVAREAGPSWSLVNRIWTAMERRWPTVVWEQEAGFAVSRAMLD
jgi:hypothetical protein